MVLVLEQELFTGTSSFPYFKLSCNKTIRKPWSSSVLSSVIYLQLAADHKKTFLTSCFHLPHWYLNSLISWANPSHPASAWIHGFILHNCNGLCEMTWFKWGCGARLSRPKCFLFLFFVLRFVLFFVFYVCVPQTVSPLLRRISWIFLKWIKM